MQIEVGAILEGKVTGITSFGAFVSLPENKTGMVHISEVSSSYVKEIKDFLKPDQSVTIKVIGIDERGKIALSIKQAAPPESKIKPAAPVEFTTFVKPKASSGNEFEDMMSHFKQQSDEKMSDLKRANDAKRGSAGYSKHGSK